MSWHREHVQQQQPGQRQDLQPGHRLAGRPAQAPGPGQRGGLQQPGQAKGESERHDPQQQAGGQAAHERDDSGNCGQCGNGSRLKAGAAAASP